MSDDNNGLTELRGGVAVVTGAASGIGEGVARAAAERGMTVVVVDIAAEGAEQVAADLRAQGSEALAIPTDVTDPAQVEALAEQVYARFGRTTLLVNNVGVELLGYIWTISAEDWRRMLDVNVLGMIHVTRAFIPRMLASGEPGSIAKLSSIGGLGMAPLQSTYMVSKHAVLTLAESLALEMEVVGAPIRVSAVLPGPVTSRIFETAKVVGDDPLLRAHHESMRRMNSEHGLEPVEAGRRILTQIAAGEFWVSPHPEMLDRVIERRVDVLRSRSQPRLSDEMRRDIEATRSAS